MLPSLATRIPKPPQLPSVDIVSHNSQSFIKGVTCYNHIEFIDRFSFLSKCMFYAGVCFTGRIKGKYSEVFKQLVDFLDFLIKVVVDLLTTTMTTMTTMMAVRMAVPRMAVTTTAVTTTAVATVAVAAKTLEART